MMRKTYEDFQATKSGADNEVPPEELIDSSPDEGDIPQEILNSASEARKDYSYD